MAKYKENEINIKEIARKKGWSLMAWHASGKCRWCHQYIFCFDWSVNIWISPKGMYYHKNCAIKRLKRRNLNDKK